ncbi:hypothetical protein L207DRAFT_522398 [Hyaloscypha variabilis F]|uniref:Heterokaryon incompatibility domain-containing protein n=1 Tax=Hyaloscypha variabilis (strain UAMH 11265 / GT02V1 / F) TaxID=1149755 RepID=A0A2J6SEB7_HYAVF|nr:hypothetical protein L207DRAFT_522398 [Hyaloscypha variabilis F]
MNTDFVKGLYSRGCSVPSNASDDADSHYQPADSYTGSTENLSLAQLWLEKCLLSHKECAQTVTAPLASPTRLIDLEDPENPRLCQTEGFNLEYLTLSYCWDNQGDVQQEMNRMAQIYQNSILIIAANSGPDISSGLYIERDPRLLKPCNAPCTIMEGDQILRGTISFWPSDEREELSPLHNRGWVFQEQIMSTRILTFGLYEMRWTCV